MNFTINTLNCEIMRYALVGLVAFVADTAVLYMLTTFAGVQYLLSAVSGFIIGVTVNYLLSIQFVFTNVSQYNCWAFSLFVFIGLIGLGLNELVMWYFTEWMGFHYLLSKIVAVVTVFFWNYGARKKFCFESGVIECPKEYASSEQVLRD